MPSQFDAIIAQNVLAHVPHPVDFLRACAAAMAPWTRLYIQTSQCQMHQEGQFDTAYHEHLSFFTSHSFLAASTLAGLRILDFMTTPIHGESCLWTLDLDPAPPPKGEVSGHSAFSPLYGNGASANRLTHSSVTLAARLRQEAEDGLTSDFFYQRFGARAEETCSWIEMHLFALRQASYRIGAYGAAAKGMVLLHYLLARTKRLDKDGGISFVLDDAQKKQGTYCPGTRIPVLRTDDVADMTQPADPPLAIVVLAWNFWPEVQFFLLRLVGSSHNDSFVALLPFPTPRLLNLHGRTVSRFVYRPTPPGTELPFGIPSTATLVEADRSPPVDCQKGYTDCSMGKWRNKTFGIQLNNNIGTALRLPTFNCKGPGGVTARRRPVMLVSHFFNEEKLLPYWIRHHAPMFDHAVLIDYNSTDQSVEIIKREAPPTWRVVLSTQPEFGADTCDYQVMREEMRFPDLWHATLTTTKFIVHADLRGELAKSSTRHLVAFA